MIRLNVFLLIEESENRELSLHDKGCVAYDIFASQTVDNHLMICETWRTKEDLEAHMATEHFKRIVPEMESLATMTLEEFTF